MNGLKKLFCAAALCLTATAVWASTFTFKSSTGDSVTFNVPEEFDSFIKEYEDQIQQAINDNGVSTDDLSNAANEINGHGDALKSFAEAYNGIEGSLDTFAGTLLKSIPSAQVGQNQWAQAWIGSLLPTFNMGGGVNVSAATVDIKPIKSFCSELGITALDSFNADSIPFPVVAADIRLGGIILPFDIGFSVMKLDTSKIDSLNQAMNGIALDYFTIGGDIRYAVFKLPLFNFRVSASAGYYYTSTKLSYAGSSSDMMKGAKLNLETSTFVVGAQASAKFLRILVPFAGARLMVSNGSMDWSLTPNWNQLLTGMDSAATYFLPKTFAGKTSSETSWQPQLYVGLGLDLFVVDITASVGYTFGPNVFNGAVSLRVAWN